MRSVKTGSKSNTLKINFLSVKGKKDDYISENREYILNRDDFFIFKKTNKEPLRRQPLNSDNVEITVMDFNNRDNVISSFKGSVKDGRIKEGRAENVTINKQKFTCAFKDGVPLGHARIKTSTGKTSEVFFEDEIKQYKQNATKLHKRNITTSIQGTVDNHNNINLINENDNYNIDIEDFKNRNYDSDIIDIKNNTNYYEKKYYDIIKEHPAFYPGAKCYDEDGELRLMISGDGRIMYDGSFDKNEKLIIGKKTFVLLSTVYDGEFDDKDVLVNGSIKKYGNTVAEIRNRRVVGNVNNLPAKINNKSSTTGKKK